MPDVGARLRQLRERAGLSLDQLADLTGGVVGGSAIGRIERGERSPTLETMQALAHALDVEFNVTASYVIVTELV